MVIEAKANVTMPDMHISTDVLEFSDVKCGECKVITVQLHNHQHVRCEWNSVPTEKDKKKVPNIHSNVNPVHSKGLFTLNESERECEFFL